MCAGWGPSAIGHKRPVEVGIQPNFEWRVAGRYLSKTMPNWERAKTS